MEVAMVVSSNAHSQKLIPHKKNNRFYNLEHEKSRGVFLHSFFMFTKSYLKRRFCAQKTSFSIPETKKVQFSSGDIEITWIGHSTFLIKLGEIRLITDPIFGDASLLFRRIAPPGISLKELGALDYVLLSHNHRDHMDAKSLLHMRAHQPTLLVPKGDKRWFAKRAFNTVYEAEWWQEIICHTQTEASLRFYFLPAYHWSQRSLFDRNRSLWGSWLIEYNGYRIYFGGDTANWHHFNHIAQTFPSIDIALLPVGPCEPRKWMHHSHINAQEAGEAFLTLGAKHFVPMHWGTFHFGLDAIHAPIEQLYAWWEINLNKLEHAHLHIPQVGQKLLFNSDYNASEKIIKTAHREL